MVYSNDVVEMYTERLATLFNPVKVKMHVINTLKFFDVRIIAYPVRKSRIVPYAKVLQG